MDGPAVRSPNASQQDPFAQQGLDLLHEYCFAAGTLVLTAEGPKPIEQIQPGDRVACMSDRTPDAPIDWRPVEQTYHNSPAELLNVHIALVVPPSGGCQSEWQGTASPPPAEAGTTSAVPSTVLRTTFNHPFYVPGQGWTAAGDLQIGDQLRTADGSPAIVTDLFPNGDIEPVFNLRVAGHHTYFVGIGNVAFVLVHNESPGAATKFLGLLQQSGARNADLQFAAAQFGRLSRKEQEAAISAAQQIADKGGGSGQSGFRFSRYGSEQELAQLDAQQRDAGFQKMDWNRPLRALGGNRYLDLKSNVIQIVDPDTCRVTGHDYSRTGMPSVSDDAHPLEAPPKDASEQAWRTYEIARAYKEGRTAEARWKLAGACFDMVPFGLAGTRAEMAPRQAGPQAVEVQPVQPGRIDPHYVPAGRPPGRGPTIFGPDGPARVPSGPRSVYTGENGPTKLAFNTGAEGEAHLAEMYPGGQTQVKFETQVGRGAQRFRYVDVLQNKIAHESKVGYRTLGNFEAKQIAKDAWLLKNSDEVNGVTWHFFRSAETGKIGASQELLQALAKNGIKYVIHD